MLKMANTNSVGSHMAQRPSQKKKIIWAVVAVATALLVAIVAIAVSHGSEDSQDRAAGNIETVSAQSENDASIVKGDETENDTADSPAGSETTDANKVAKEADESGGKADNNTSYGGGNGPNNSAQDASNQDGPSDNTDSAGENQPGEVTEPDGSKWTGYYK